MFQKGEEIEIYIEDISQQGQGIGKVNGFAVFVRDVIPGDRVKCLITKVKKSFAFAKPVEFIEASESRITPPCPYYKDCGGCDFGEINYQGQLEIKEKQVRDRLIRIGGLSNPKINNIIPMDEPFFYRNKAVMQISTGGNIMRKGGIIENLGEPAVGFFKKKTHEVVDCEECLLQNPATMAAAKAMRGFMEEDNITAWDEKWQQGLMRQMTVKTASGTGEAMVIITINGKGIPNALKLINMLDDYIYDAGYTLESVYVGNNKNLVNIAGKKVIEEILGDTKFEISPRSFYQVNPKMTVLLYNKVREYACLTGNENILDLYCGVGSIGLWCAKDAGKVLGIEREESAVIDANRNAVINGIVNARYIKGETEEILPELLKQGDEAAVDKEAPSYGDDEVIRIAQNVDVVILASPRSGCREELLDAVAEISPKKIVYVSCDAATLARDIKYLTTRGYNFIEATPVDVFCHTRHVECIALIQRVKS